MPIRKVWVRWQMLSADLKGVIKWLVTIVVISFCMVVISRCDGRHKLPELTSYRSNGSAAPVHISCDTVTLAPVVNLSILEASMESAWSTALAIELSGTTEFVVEHGRVDVLTDTYAIEVERLEKWHEAIGQAVHYAHLTEKAPVIAVIMPTDMWPMSNITIRKIRLIDELCLKHQIKLVLLRRSTTPAQ